jgi:hypothetical protein
VGRARGSTSGLPASAEVRQVVTGGTLVTDEVTLWSGFWCKVGKLARDCNNGVNDRTDASPGDVQRATVRPLDHRRLREVVSELQTGFARPGRNVGERGISIEIESRRVLKGELPVRALSLVSEWTALHKAELLDNWRLCREKIFAGQSQSVALIWRWVCIGTS